MSDAIGMEARFFLASVLCGILLLICYDILRIFRRVVKHAWFLVAVEDLIFWIISGVVIFRMMYKMNNGTIRAFSILGMLLGMIVYNQSISTVLVEGISDLFILINKGIVKAIFIISKPFRFVCRYIKKVLSFIKKVFTKIGFKFNKLLKRKGNKSNIDNNENERE